MSQVFKIFTDGGSRANPGKAASAAVIYDSAGKLRLICGKYLGVATNNVAEYTAVLIALTELKNSLGDSCKNTTVQLYADSNLVVNQLNGIFKIKKPELGKLAAEIKTLEKNFAKVSYQHVFREQNTEADREVNKILDSQK